MWGVWGERKCTKVELEAGEDLHLEEGTLRTRV